jgi:hypothetical protein
MDRVCFRQGARVLVVRGIGLRFGPAMLRLGAIGFGFRAVMLG